MSILLFFIGLFATPAWGAGDEEKQLQIAAEGMYRVVISHHMSGIPDEPERTLLRPWISAALNQRLILAQRAEERHARATQNEEPPLMEGHLFSSLFEGPDNFVIHSCIREKSDIGQCMVSFSITPPNDSTTTWQDKVFLVQEQQGWRIDDMEFLGHWSFGHAWGRLGDLLDEVAREPEESVVTAPRP